MGRNVLQYHAAGTNFGATPDFDIAKNFGAGSDQDAVADFRVTVTFGLAGAAEGDVMQYRHIVFNHRCFAYDEAVTVIQQNTAPNACGRVDVDSKGFRNPVLQKQCEGVTPLIP